jgi:hypothetical protein
MSDPALTENEKAFFTVAGTRVPLDFNPVNLQLTVQTQAKGEGGAKVQHVSTSSAKLDMELVFDSTDSGQDVRQRTQALERFLVPAQGKTPPQVKFEWGAFTFEGVADSLKQTFDYFSRNGVPLRSTVGLSLAQSQYKFEPVANTRSASVDPTLDLGGGSPAGVASAGGDPAAARGIAAANGLESLRADAGAGLSVGGGVSIGAAAGFAPSGGAGAGLGFGLGLNVGAGAGLNLGTGGSLSLGGGPSAGAGVRVGAPFASLQPNLRVTAGAPTGFDPARLFAAVSAPSVAKGSGFDVSGRANPGAGSSFKADVTGGIHFDAL